MSVLQIIPIVEGHGEVFAVPVLLRRLAQQCNINVRLDIKRVSETKRWPRAPPGSLIQRVGAYVRSFFPQKILGMCCGVVCVAVWYV